MTRLKAVFFFALLTTGASAALEQTLDQGLYYVRIDNADTDATVAEKALAKPALALDLRYTQGKPEALAELANKIASTPVEASGHRLVLISPRTPAAVVDALHHASPRQLTVAPRASTVHADITVGVTPEEDQQAYDAANHGTPIAKLIANATDKRRFDEATLAHNRNAIDPDDGPDDAADSTEPAEAPTKPAGPHDRVLERTVEIHEGLAALKQ